MTVSPQEPLGYMGVNLRKQPRFITAQRNPSSNDQQFPGTQWYNSVSKMIFITSDAGVWEVVVGSSTPAALSWINNATSQVMAVNTGYIITAGAQAFTMPAACAVGDALALSLAGGTSFTVTLGAHSLKTITAGGAPATYSTSFQSNNSDATFIEMLCVGANVWVTRQLIGSLTGS